MKWIDGWYALNLHDIQDLMSPLVICWFVLVSSNEVHSITSIQTE
jgi:hypothetical protein